jgi:hypothetical protein
LEFDVCCGPRGVAELEANVAESKRQAGIDRAIVYAFQRTHLMVTTQHRETPLAFAADLDEWDDAVAEYRESIRSTSREPGLCRDLLTRARSRRAST